jgi:16S rRNA (cytosine967-C5)-methyltransferase
MKKQVFNARDAALISLQRIDRNVHAEQALREAVAVLADSRERGLAMELLYGVLRWKSRLDAELLTRLRMGTDETLVHILRIGLYQMRHLDRVPERAALHGAVEQAKQHGFSYASGMVNAILRACQREGEPAWPEGSDAEALALRFAHPPWLVEGWRAQYGPEVTAAILAADQEIPPHGVRIRPGQRDEALAWFLEQGFDAVTGQYAPGALRVRGGGDPQTWPGMQTGDWVLQDEGAQAMAGLLPPASLHLDLCAAPGGKSFLLADRDAGSRIVAVEKNSDRLTGLTALRDKLGLDGRIETVLADAAEATVAPGQFPSVLVDAPCSGLGTLRRNPDRKWRGPPDTQLPERQMAILEQAARQTAPGGHLLYITCTLWRAENEDVAAAFSKSHPAFAPVAAAHPLLRADGYYECRPDLHGTDGFFAALWRRKD